MNLGFSLGPAVNRLGGAVRSFRSQDGHAKPACRRSGRGGQRPYERACDACTTLRHASPAQIENAAMQSGLILCVCPDSQDVVH